MIKCLFCSHKKQCKGEFEYTKKLEKDVERMHVINSELTTTLDEYETALQELQSK